MSDDIEKHSGSDEEGSKPVLIGKKKKKEKDKGYKMFEAEDSGDEPIVYDDSIKAATPKLKKGKPSFKFAVRKEVKVKSKEKEKDEKKETTEKDKKEEKETRRRKVKDKDKWRKKKKSEPVPEVVEVPVFGVPLPVAVERSPSHDGLPLPVVFRECVDYIEEHGLLYEGIYRVSGVKSKVQHLKDCYNRQQPAYLYEHEPSIVASLLKQFLRELPEPVLTDEHMPKFEEASVIKNSSEKIERMHALLGLLPPCNRELLSWTIVHMSHIIAKEKINKMGIQNVSIVLSPTMRISHRVLNVLFIHAKHLFAGVSIKRYVPPLQPTASRWSVDLPDTEESIREELQHQESLLNHLHQQMSRHTIDPEKEERLWEVQRVVTQLKRKLKLTAKTNAAKQMEKEQLAAGSLARSDPNRRSINAAELNFALQSISRQTSRSTSDVAVINVSGTPSRSSVQEVEKKSPAGTFVPDHLELSREQTTPTDVTPVSPEARVPQMEAGAISDGQDSDGVSEVLEKLEDVELSDEEGSLDTNPTSMSEQVVDDDACSKQEERHDRPPQESYGMMKESSSLDSDITLSAASAGISASLSQSSFNDFKASDDAETRDGADIQTPTPNTVPDNDEVRPATPVGSPQTISQVQSGDERLTPNEESEDKSTVSVDHPEEIIPTTSSQPERQQPSVQSEMKASPVESSSPDPAVPPMKRDTSSDLLVPEKLHQAPETTDNDQKEPNQMIRLEDDEELRRMIAEEAQLIWEEEELIATRDELKQKISTEKVEMERLEEEIAEYEELRSITTAGHSSEYHSSDYDSYLSTSDTDPPSDGEAYEELDNMVAKRDLLVKQNQEYEAHTSDLVNKIHEERMICLGIKIQIRLLQQQILSSSKGYGEESLL